MAKKLLKLTTLLAILLLVFMLTGCPKPPVEYTLTIEKTGSGDGTVNADPEPNTSGKYTAGTDVTLTAEADAGSQFVKWIIGETEETGNPLVVKMDADKTVEAVFEEVTGVQFTLTVAKAGDGDGTVTPPVGPHEYDEGKVVTLIAEADENSVFDKWVVDGVEFEDATVIATMTKDILATAHFDPKPDVLPEIILEWTLGDLMVLGAPCAAPEDGLGFQYLVGDSDSSLTEASWSIVKGEEVVYGPIAIPSSRFYNSWTGAITAAMLGADPVGGIYSLTMTATKTGGISKTEKIDFYVHTDEAAIDGVDFAGEIVLFEGTAILTGDEATLEATITLDSKVRVRIYAYEGEWDCECVDNALLYDGFLTREASSTEKETFELDLTKLKSGVNYDKLRIIVYNEICGTMPCNYCPDDEKDIDLVFDKTVTLDCEPCTCAPCTPCWNGEFNPGVRIMNLLFKDSDFFDVSATINGETIPATLIEAPVEDGDDLVIRAIIREEDFPELAGDALLIWTVTTVTGQSVVVECDEDFDFIPPEVDILLECDCDATTTVVPILFTDEAGLKEANVWFGESVSGLIKKVTFDATPTGESTTTFTSGFTSGWEFPATGMIYDVIATIELDPAKIVSPTLGGSYTVYADAEDTSCNISDVAMETCAIDFVAPTITYFGLDCVGTDCDLCEATQTTLVWHIRDVNFDYAEISVNYGNLCSDGQCGNTFITESKDGTVLWEFPFADCREITATIKAVDDCENESSKTIKFDVDNVPPELDLEWCVEPETCDATFARFSWTMDDPCTPTVYFDTWIPIGELDYVVMENGKEVLYPYTPDGTTTKSGIIQWSWENCFFDCTELTIFAEAVDFRCENSTEASLTTDVALDFLPPEAHLFLGESQAKYAWEAYENETNIGSPDCDATCLWVNWIVFEDCLESIEIWSNYPSVCETGGTGEYLEDEYLLFAWPEMNAPTGSGWRWYSCGDENETAATIQAAEGLDGDNGFGYYYPAKYYWGSIKVCLPSNLDCEDFVATITAVQTCKPDIDEPETYTSVDDDNALIDRKAPEILTFDWLTVPTACATEATVTIEAYDGSFIGKSSVDAYIEGEMVYEDGEVVPFGGETVLLTIDPVTGIATGTYWNTYDQINCATIVATLTVGDICCDGVDPNLSVQRLEIDIDNVKPNVNDFYFASEANSSDELSDVSGDGWTMDVDETTHASLTACGTDFVYLYWDADDITGDSTGCYAGVEILMEHGDGTVDVFESPAATGTVKWEFGEVAGDTLLATITAQQENGCLESDPATVSAYVSNVGPQFVALRFQVPYDPPLAPPVLGTIWVDFNVPIDTSEATANIWRWDDLSETWMLETYVDGNPWIWDKGITGDDNVDLKRAQLVNVDGTIGYPIVLDGLYKLELYSIKSVAGACEGIYIDPLVRTGTGRITAPEF
ncbi:hypothetical protein Theba_0230 [Mesotoga prima MesG1.Ag.4.2]|uniref:Bacterial repeat domain-containing protein n=1 Tax=Mesotoga prima MesG1.Ag.4.2 TaxID=660470 RepID=I2F211_9BACT|nr:hypothetical protein [Mesotoga prima]AFK05964.1 hypothetical protein Theba_0230 [Mesotoga prima MesG1.Ag.4.2]